MVICTAQADGGRKFSGLPVWKDNLSAKMSLRSEARMMNFSLRVRTGAAERSIEFTASKRRARQSWDGSEK